MIDFEKVSDSVWAHIKGETRGNVAYIRLNNFIVFVDSGMDPLTARIARRVAENTTNIPVKYLVLTHHHADHVLGAQVFEDCDIISSKKTAELMEKQKDSWSGKNLEEHIKNNPEFAERWKHLKLVFPTKTFSGKTRISDGEKEIQVIETGGHTAGSSFVYVPWEKVIIAGDLLFLGTWPYGGDPTADPYLWLNALKTMLSYNVKYVVPGHGPLGTKEDIQNYYEFMRGIIKKIESLVQEGVKKDALLTQKALPSISGAETDRDIRFRKLTLEHFYDVISAKLAK